MDKRQPPILVGDAAGLDFLNSIATPGDVPVDWINDGAGLLHWLRHTDLVPAAVLADLRKRALPGELDEVAADSSVITRAGPSKASILNNSSH
jgi:hypothetical protein